MATGSVDESLQDLLTCVICFKFEGRDPRCLPCQHAFCTPCLTDILKTAQRTAITNNIYCPMCENLTTIPGGRVENLPKFFIGSKIQDILKQQGQVKQFRCTLCRRNPDKALIVSYCFGCTTAMCLDCKAKHDNKPRNKSHVCCPVTQSTIKYVTCHTHDKHVEAFCVDCKKAVCSVCLADDHDDHSIHDFSLAEEDSGKHLEQLLKKAEEEVKINAKGLAEMKRRVNADLDAVQSEVDGHHTLMLKTIRQQHTDLSQQIQQHRKQVNVEIEKSQNLVDEAEALIAKLQNQSTCWRQPLPEMSLIRLADVERLSGDIKRQIPSLTECHQEPKPLRFQPGAILSLGELSDAVEESLRATAAHDRGQGKHTPPCLDKGFRLTVKKSFSKAQLVWNVGDFVCVDFLRDGSVIVGCDSGIRVLDPETGRRVTHGLSYVYLEKISYVAASRTADTVAAVTVGKPGCLHIMTADGGQWSKKTNKVHDLPSCVTLTTDNSVLISYNRNNLTKYNIQGVELGQIALSSVPYYICTDNTNRIIVSYDDRVTVYDGSREILSLPAASEQRELNPTGVCTDSDDNIYICDLESSAVLKYDRRGQYVDAIQLEKMPKQVAIYQDRLLAVMVCDDDYCYNVILYRL